MRLQIALPTAWHRLRSHWGRRRRQQGSTDVDIAARLAAIERCRARLHRFGCESDQEFTDLARGLGRLNSRLAELRTQTAALDAVLHDKDEDRAISSAYSLYKDSVDLVHSSAGIAVSAQDQLTQVEAALAASCRDSRTFDRDHLFLRIVTLGIRVEASRLPADAQAVFLNVASAISETSGQIQACTATAFAEIEDVIRDSQAARLELRATEDALQVQARKSIETIQRELTTLRAALEPCVEHSGAITELFAKAQPQTIGVIAALQHQDIVRQQLEHVAEGFQDIEEHFRTAQNDGRGDAVEWKYILQASRIQAAQLESSRKEVEGAGTAVINGLRILLETSTRMVDRFSSMETSASSALDRCRISELFSQELHGLTEMIQQSQQANIRTTRLVERIENVVRLFSKEIGRHELDVKIVALNAQIAAARLPSADALNRLAEETSRLADTNSGLTRRLSADLEATLGTLDQVKRGGADFLGIATRERAQLETGVVEVTDKLSRLVQRVRSGAVQARASFAPVHAESTALLDQLKFPSLAQDTFSSATQLCQQLVADSEGRHGTDVPNAATESKIRHHQSRYTMRKEEATHHAALEGNPAPAISSTDSTEVGSIELFGAMNDPLGAEPARGTACPHTDALASVQCGAPGPRPQPDSISPIAGKPPPTAAADSSLGDGIELF